MMDKLLQISLEEVKSGYSYNAENSTYTCLTCGKEFEEGEVFSIEGRFYEAAKAVRLHIEKEHDSMLKLLSSVDKKYTGLTENQKELLTMMHDGLTDNEIARKMGVAPATVRHQRFAFREKAKQAKLYLAIFELVEEAAASKKVKNTKDDLIDIHSGAKMVDDRYFITKAEEDKIIAAAFESLEPLVLKLFSAKEKKKLVVLRRIAAQFSKGVKYSEKEVNSILEPIYYDYVTIRRYLIEYGFMERTLDCKEYWLK